MPYLPQQHRLFEAAAHSPEVVKRVGIPTQQAAKMASEGVTKPKALAKAIRQKR